MSESLQKLVSKVESGEGTIEDVKIIAEAVQASVSEVDDILSGLMGQSESLIKDLDTFEKELTSIIG